MFVCARAAMTARCREAQRVMEKETTRQKAERARPEAEESGLLQTQLQSQLQQLAAANAAAAQSFAAQRAQMARESPAIARKLQELQNTTHHQSTTVQLIAQLERSSLPPHLSHSTTFTGQASVTCHQQHGHVDPFNPVIGLAEPSNPAQVSIAPAKSAPLSGTPRPEEAS